MESPFINKKDLVLASADKKQLKGIKNLFSLKKCVKVGCELKVDSNLILCEYCEDAYHLDCALGAIENFTCEKCKQQLKKDFSKKRSKQNKMASINICFLCKEELN